MTRVQSILDAAWRSVVSTSYLVATMSAALVVSGEPSFVASMTALILVIVAGTLVVLARLMEWRVDRRQERESERRLAVARAVLHDGIPPQDRRPH